MTRARRKTRVASIARVSGCRRRMRAMRPTSFCQRRSANCGAIRIVPGSRGWARRPWAESGYPGWNRAQILLIRGSEPADQTWLFVVAHRRRRDAPREGGVGDHVRRAEDQGLAEKNDQEADVDGVAYVPVKAADHQTWRRCDRDRSAAGSDELHERRHDRNETYADHDRTCRPSDHPMRQRRLKPPVAQQIRQHGAKGAPNPYAPRESDARSHRPAHLRPPRVLGSLARVTAARSRQSLDSQT